MLAKAYKDLQQNQSQARAQADKAKREAILSVQGFTDRVSDSVNDQVAFIFQNQREIEGEAKNLQALVAKYNKQTQQWLQLLTSFNNSLKELGDVQSWSQTIEREMKHIATSLEYIYTGQPKAVAEDAFDDDEQRADDSNEKSADKSQQQVGSDGGQEDIHASPAEPVVAPVAAASTHHQQQQHRGSHRQQREQQHGDDEHRDRDMDADANEENTDSDDDEDDAESELEDGHDDDEDSDTTNSRSSSMDGAQEAIASRRIVP